MAGPMPGGPDARGRFVRLADGDMHVVENGRPGAPARVELLPGVGHTPMMEDPQTTSDLLLDFAEATGYPH